MASVTMTASFLGASASTISRHPSASARRCVLVAKATRAADSGDNSTDRKEEGSAKRRDLVFAAAAAAACSIAMVAMAEPEPKPGSPEAKKKYFPVCVTMPTARICRN